MRGKKRRIKMKEFPFRKLIPNMITSGSVLCGFFSLVLVERGFPIPAAWMILIAVVFDYMDGKVARSLGGSSEFGVELDSLADVISFGVAPAFLIHSVYIGYATGFWGALSAAFFALCGALRLARFNVTHVPGSFQGLPIPAAGLTLVSFVMAGVPMTPIFAIGVLLSLAALMVSAVPYGNLKKLKKGKISRPKSLLLATLMLSMTALLQEKAPLAIALIYVTSGLLKFDWGQWLSVEREDEVNEATE